MKEILDVFMIIFFVAILAFFVIGFNKQMIEKHKNKLDENENNKKNKEDINE